MTLEELSDRELDAMVAEKALGQSVVWRWWLKIQLPEMFDDGDIGVSWGEAEFKRASKAKDVNPRMFERVLCSPWGDNWQQLAHYSTDLNAARLVEDELERRGLVLAYVDGLMDVCSIGAMDDYGDRYAQNESLYAFAHATARQRCIAALKALGVTATEVAE